MGVATAAMPAKKNHPHLSPPLLPMRFSPPSAAPKRDHDEWLVRWRPGGWWSHHPGRSLSRLRFEKRPHRHYRHGWGALPCPTTSSPRGAELPAWKRPVWRHTVDLDRGDKVPGSGEAVLGTIPGSATGEAQNPGRPARREPQSSAVYPRRGQRPRRPASSSPKGEGSLKPPKPKGCRMDQLAPMSPPTGPILRCRGTIAWTDASQDVSRPAPG